MVAPKRSTRSKVGHQPKVIRICDSFKDPETLATWLIGMAGEWQERDSRTFCLATAGRSHAIEDDDKIIEVGLFEAIEDQLSDLEYSLEIRAGIKRLMELVKDARHGN